MRGTHLPSVKETNDCRLERANQRVAFSEDRDANRPNLKYLTNAQLHLVLPTFYNYYLTVYILLREFQTY